MALQEKSKIESIELGPDNTIIVKRKDYYLTSSGTEVLIGYHTHTVTQETNLDSTNPQDWWCTQEVKQIAAEYFN